MKAFKVFEVFAGSGAELTASTTCCWSFLLPQQIAAYMVHQVHSVHSNGW